MLYRIEVTLLDGTKQIFRFVKSGLRDRAETKYKRMKDKNKIKNVRRLDDK